MYSVHVQCSWWIYCIYIHARRHIKRSNSRMDHFVPHWHFSATSRSVRLEDSMPNSDATVWIHLCYTIVLIQPRLQNKHTKYPVDSPFSALTLLVGDRKGIRPVKKLDVGIGLLVVTIWLELCTTYSSGSLVVTTTSIILCFNKHRLTQVHLENGR